MAEDRRYVIQVVGDLAASGGGAPRGPGMGGPPVNTDGGPQQIQNPNLNLMAKHLREIAAGTTGLGSISVISNNIIAVTQNALTGSTNSVTVTGVSNIALTGVHGTGVLENLLVWGDVVPGQTTSYSEVSTSQTPDYSVVSTSQSPNYSEVSTSQTPSYSGVSTSQSPDWEDIAA